MEENTWVKKTRFLSQVLMFSGALNICLITTLIYFAYQTQEEKLHVVEKVPSLSTNRTNEQLLQAYSFLPFSELILRLENVEPIEEGLCKRDLALACLVAFHHFPLDKALGGWIPQKRQIAMHDLEGKESIGVGVFPGLSDFQFQAILQFAKTEKWPLSSQGLFYELKRQKGAYDASLLEAFYLTSEFHQVATVFLKTGLTMSRVEIVDLVTSGDWALLAEWSQWQKETGDLSLEARRSLLSSYLTVGSSLAAEVLFKVDNEHVVKKLSDPEMLFMLSVLKDKKISCESLVQEIFASPRTDAVRHFAATLYPDLKPKEVVIASVELKEPKEKEEVTLTKIRHTVVPGDTLWKIAKTYKVSVKDLKACNHLDDEKLKVGRQLEIPEKHP